MPFYKIADKVGCCSADDHMILAALITHFKLGRVSIMIGLKVELGHDISNQSQIQRSLFRAQHIRGSTHANRASEASEHTSLDVAIRNAVLMASVRHTQNANFAQISVQSPPSDSAWLGFIGKHGQDQPCILFPLLPYLLQ